MVDASSIPEHRKIGYKEQAKVDDVDSDEIAESGYIETMDDANQGTIGLHQYLYPQSPFRQYLCRYRTWGSCA